MHGLGCTLVVRPVTLDSEALEVSHIFLYYVSFGPWDMTSVGISSVGIEVESHKLSIVCRNFIDTTLTVVDIFHNYS